jgi:hypothetical protein
MDLPAGLAVRVEEGQQLLLNLHLVNTSSDAVDARTAIQVQVAEPGSVRHLADAVLMGPMDLNIPPGDHQSVGRCTVREEAFLFAVTPHMHQLGTHMQLTAHSSLSGEVKMYDRPYDVDDQQAELLDLLVPMHAGDHVEVRCDYRNDTGKMVHWGARTRDEMCFAGVFRYPRSSEAQSVCSF